MTERDEWRRRSRTKRGDAWRNNRNDFSHFCKKHEGNCYILASVDSEAHVRPSQRRYYRHRLSSVVITSDTSEARPRPSLQRNMPGMQHKNVYGYMFAWKLGCLLNATWKYIPQQRYTYPWGGGGGVLDSHFTKEKSEIRQEGETLLQSFISANGQCTEYAALL